MQFLQFTKTVANTMSNQSLIVKREGAVLTLSNNGAPWNRMTFAYMDELEAAVDGAAADPSLRVVVFTAEGDANFSVGMDLKQLMTDSHTRGGLEAILDQRLRVLA
jgi:enoyl-CoA hydratase/carnithine racemase